GGGAGSGAVPEFARIAKEMNVITFGIFTMPFKFEGDKKYQVARKAIERVSPNLNVLQVFPNELIFRIIDKSTPFQKAFSAVNKKILDNIEGLIETIYLPGLINIDFADLKAILEGKGKLAYLNNAEAEGENRAEEAVKKLVLSPLNEYVLPDDSGDNTNSFLADKILYNICSDKDLGMQEVEQISRTIHNFNKKAKIIFGISQDSKYKNKIKITLLATGEINKKPKNKKKKKNNVASAEKPEKPDKGVNLKEEEKIKLPPVKAQTVKLKTKKKVKIIKTANAKIKPLKKANKKPVRKKVSLIKKTEKEVVEGGAVLKIRRTALDLKREAEETEKKMLEEEKKWDIPAFLRRKQENN
ncbi:MAG: cell division protein FtsZ, partial [Candidatus Parcubacteria bacterium]|nr:cell division protein FtsZ [Candidatus Parcubacteria bacterium]